MCKMGYTELRFNIYIYIYIYIYIFKPTISPDFTGGGGGGGDCQCIPPVPRFRNLIPRFSDMRYIYKIQYYIYPDRKANGKECLKFKPSDKLLQSARCATRGYNPEYDKKQHCFLAAPDEMKIYHKRHSLSTFTQIVSLDHPIPC